MNRGMTLVETIIVITFCVLAMTVLTSFYLLFKSTIDRQQAVSASVSTAGTAVNAIAHAVMAASQTLVSRTFSSGDTYSSGANVLVLELPSIDSTGKVLIGTKDYVAFYVSGDTLYQLTDSGAGSARLAGKKILSPYITSLAFSYNDVDYTKVTRVGVDLRTQAQVNSQVAQDYLIENIYLRNYIDS